MGRCKLSLLSNTSRTSEFIVLNVNFCGRRWKKIKPLNMTLEIKCYGKVNVVETNKPISNHLCRWYLRCEQSVRRLLATFPVESDFKLLARCLCAAGYLKSPFRWHCNAARQFVLVSLSWFTIRILLGSHGVWKPWDLGRWVRVRISHFVFISWISDLPRFNPTPYLIHIHILFKGSSALFKDTSWGAC